MARALMRHLTANRRLLQIRINLEIEGEDAREEYLWVPGTG